MSFEINEDPAYLTNQNSQSGANKLINFNQKPLTKLMLNNIQIDGVSGLSRILESALTGKPLPSNN